VWECNLCHDQARSLKDHTCRTNEPRKNKPHTRRPRIPKVQGMESTQKKSINTAQTNDNEMIEEE